MFEERIAAMNQRTEEAMAANEMCIRDRCLNGKEYSQQFYTSVCQGIETVEYLGELK